MKITSGLSPVPEPRCPANTIAVFPKQPEGEEQRCCLSKLYSFIMTGALMASDAIWIKMFRDRRSIRELLGSQV